MIADNASNDRTPAIAQDWANRHPEVRVLRLEQKGRGRALREAWSGSPADILSYMDVDLSSDLVAFPALIEALAGGGYDLATGSRLLKPSLTTRGLKREILGGSARPVAVAPDPGPPFRDRRSRAASGGTRPRAVTRQKKRKIEPTFSMAHAL